MASLLKKAAAKAPPAKAPAAKAPAPAARAPAARAPPAASTANGTQSRNFPRIMLLLLTWLLPHHIVQAVTAAMAKTNIGSSQGDPWAALKAKNPAMYAKIIGAQAANDAAIKAGKIKPFKVVIAKVRAAAPVVGKSRYRDQEDGRGNDRAVWWLGAFRNYAIQLDDRDGNGAGTQITTFTHKLIVWIVFYLSRRCVKGNSSPG